MNLFLSFTVRNDSKIYFRVVYNGSARIRSTNFSCKKSDFDAKWSKVKPSHALHETINIGLSAIMQRAHQMSLHYTLNKIQFNPQNFLDAIFESEQDMSFVAFLESEIKLKRDLCEPNTHKKRITQLNKLKRFAPAAKLSEINVAWIERYHGWWKREGANPTTINKALSLLRTFMNWAIKKDLIKKNPFDDYVIKGYTPERRVLSKFEVTRLMECYRSGELTPAQKETLRHFLFACFTGLRYSDIENLTTNNIIENSLHIRQKKTTEPLIIPIGEQAKSFLSSIQGDKPFIVSSNQKTNKVLHRVALKAKLRPFTYHSARHTFATMGIEFGVPVPTMQNLLGHADIQTTMQYVHIAQRMKQQAISTIDSYFQK